jgi:TPR repeat protein
MVPMNVDSSTVAATSIITAVITFFFATSVGKIKPAASLALAVVVGIILNAIGVIPIGLLLVVGLSMIVAIFKAITSSPAPSESERRHALGYGNEPQQNTNAPSLKLAASPNTQGEGVGKVEQLTEPSDPQADVRLGVLHRDGNGMPQNYVHSAQCFRRAAEQGNAEAQFNLGTFFIHGHGVSQDYVQAAQWLRKAAEQGYALAQHQLGTLYNGGLGVPKDYVQAARWYRKAAEQGIAIAQYHMGKLFIHGVGVSKDYVQAEHWTRKAAEQGYADAQYHLGIMYEIGAGVAQDCVLALHWCVIARASGCTDTTLDQTLEKLVNLVTPSQRAQAEQSTAEWWAAHHSGT